MTVRPADRLRIRAADWNAMALAARQLASMPIAVGAGGPQMLATSPTTALARNTGEETIPRYGAVICSAPIVSPEDNEAEWASRLAVDCATPGAEEIDPWAWVAIATVPIGPGKIGRVCVSGAVQAIVEVANAEHRFAVAAPEVEFLQSADGGPVRILWKESGVGEKKAIVAVNAGIVTGAVVSGQILSATETEDEATLGYQGYIVARHQNVATDLFSASGPAIPCVNAFELSGDLQDQVQDESPGTKTLLRLPAGTLVGPIVQLPVPAEVGELWMFSQSNAYGVEC